MLPPGFTHTHRKNMTAKKALNRFYTNCFKTNVLLEATFKNKFATIRTGSEKLRSCANYQNQQQQKNGCRNVVSRFAVCNVQALVNVLLISGLQQ